MSFPQSCHLRLQKRDKSHTDNPNICMCARCVFLLSYIRVYSAYANRLERNNNLKKKGATGFSSHVINWGSAPRRVWNCKFWRGGNLEAGGVGLFLLALTAGTVRSPTGTHHRHGFCTESHTAHFEFNLFFVTVRLRALPRRCRGRARQAHLHGGDVQRSRAHCAPLCHVLRSVVSGRADVHDSCLLKFGFWFFFLVLAWPRQALSLLTSEIIAGTEVSAQELLSTLAS